jgi:hypothetical protein
MIQRGGRWPRGQCARRAIVKGKQDSQKSVIGWVTKIYHVEFVCDSETILSRCSRLHLQFLAPTCQAGGRS